MSGRTGIRGTRRTRVYDCNYNMGESYYKPVLDRMDRKYSGRPEVPEPRLRSVFDEPEMAAPEESLFDSRGARATRGRPLSTAIEDEEFDDEISASLKRIRANKKSSRFAEDLEFDSALAGIDSRSRLSDKLLESVGLGSSEVSGARRALAENEERTERRIARRLKDEDNSITRWTALKSSSSEEESSAAQRARATRARLTDLEDEMTERSERSAAREQRAARLRALVADTDAATDQLSSLKISSRSEKKQVTF